jgi:hypothetical protein
MKLKNFCVSGGLAALACALVWAQAPGVLTVSDPAKLRVPRTGSVEQSLKLRLQPGYHVNSDKPNDDFLIPLRLSWEKGAVETVAVEFPKPVIEKSEISEKPLSLFTGNFEIVTKFKRAPGAVPGPGLLTGKLRYQACNDKMCLPPKNIELKVPLLVE